MNILVTGANGFLGSNICNLLSKNHNIYAASRTFTKLSKHNIVCIRSEMSDYITLNETIKDNKIDETHLDIIYLIILNNKNLIKMNLYLKIYILMFGR